MSFFLITVAYLVSTFGGAPLVHSIFNSSEIATTLAPQPDRVKVEVNLESLCPDSRRFVSRQLVPTFSALGDIMQVDIIPFGHARTLGQNKMICQHGARECEGNRRMACIIARTNGDQNLIVPTIGCLFTLGNLPKACMEQHLPGIPIDEIEKCKDSDESYKMMEDYEKKTGRIDYVPRIKINDNYNEDVQEEAENDLLKAVCNYYKGQIKPKNCTEEQSASTW